MDQEKLKVPMSFVEAARNHVLEIQITALAVTVAKHVPSKNDFVEDLLDTLDTLYDPSVNKPVPQYTEAVEAMLKKFKDALLSA